MPEICFLLHFLFTIFKSHWGLQPPQPPLLRGPWLKVTKFKHFLVVFICLKNELFFKYAFHNCIIQKKKKIYYYYLDHNDLRKCLNFTYFNNLSNVVQKTRVVENSISITYLILNRPYLIV